MANRFQKYVKPAPLPFEGNPYTDDIGVSGETEADIYRAMGAEPPARQNRFAKYAQQPQEQFGPPAPLPEKGLFGRIGEDYQSRRMNVAEIRNARKAGEQGYIESGFQEAGQAAGFLNDIAGEGLKSAGKVVSYLTPDFIESPVKKTGRYVLDTASNLPAFGGGSIGEKIPQELRMLEESHPRAMRNIGAAANIGTVLYAAKPVDGKDIVDASFSGAKKLNTKTVLPTSQAVKQKSQALFESGLAKGASFSDDAADELIRAAQKLTTSDDFASGAIGPTEIDGIIKRLGDARKSPMTLNSYEALDKTWGSLGHKAASAGDLDLARKYDILQSKMREIALDEKFLKGSGEGVKDYQKAVKLWAVRSKMRDIEQINEYAKYYVGGEAAGTKAGYARLAKSKKIYKYSPKEAKMIQKAAQTGIVEGPLRNLGSGLMMIGGFAKGGPAGAATAYAISKGARAAAGSLKGVESSRIGKIIAKEAVKIAPELATKAQRIPTLELKKILALTPKQAKEALQQVERK